MDEWQDFTVTSTSVLSEYMPLLVGQCDIYEASGHEDEEDGYLIRYTYFAWGLKNEVERGDIKTDVFEGGQALAFMPEPGYYPHKILPEGETFRVPDFCYLYREQSFLVSNRLFKTLQLSNKLGATSGEAVLHDLFGGVHHGYHYVSFHNPLYLPRAEKRIANVPAAERPFVYVKLNEHKEQILIHKEIYQSWKKAGFSGFLQEYHEVLYDLNQAGDVYSGVHPHTEYRSLDDWQHNRYEVYYP